MTRFLEESQQAQQVETGYIACTSNENLTGKTKNYGVAFQIVNGSQHYRVAYTNLDDCLYDEDHDILTIITGTRTYVLEGRNLAPVWDLFCRDGVLRLTVFNPNKHPVPPSDVTLISRITIPS